MPLMPAPLTRNPQRIPRLIELLTLIWEREPDLRLGQIVTIAKGESKADTFYVEDDVVEAGLRELALRK